MQTVAVSVRPEQTNVSTRGNVENNKAPRKLVKLSKRTFKNKKRPADPNMNIKPSINMIGHVDNPTIRNNMEVRNGINGGLIRS